MFAGETLCGMGLPGRGGAGRGGGDASKRGRMVRKWRSFFQNTVISIFSQTVPFLSMLQARSSAGTLDPNHAGALLVSGSFASPSFQSNHKDLDHDAVSLLVSQ